MSPKFYLLVTLLFILSPHNASAQPTIISVQLKIDNGEGGSLLSASKIKYLDLGDTIKALVISGAPANDLIVEQRFETSLTVQNEGPHLDFTEWKHGYTNWAELSQEDEVFLALPTPSENLPFPEVALGEVEKFYKKWKQKNKNIGNWDQTISTCKSIGTYPCAIGVSRIMFQVRRKSDKQKILKTIAIQNPMGC